MSAYLSRKVSSIWRLRTRRCADLAQRAPSTLAASLDLLVSKRHYFVHAGNVLVLAAINQTDMLELRKISVAASTLGVLYNLLQPVPLIAPACWGVFFISCHFYYILKLLREREHVNLATEAERVFKWAFEQHGFTRRQFLDLIEVTGARWCIVSRDQYIHRRGEPLDELSFLYEGQATQVSATGDWMRDVVGDPAAMQKKRSGGWLGELFDPNRNLEEYWSKQRFFPVSYRCSSETCRTLTVPRRALDDYFHSSKELTERATRSQMSDLWARNLQSLKQNRLHAYSKMLEVATSNGLVSAQEKRLLDDWRTRHNISESEHLQFLSEVGWTAEEYQRGRCNRIGLRGFLQQWLAPQTCFSSVGKSLEEQCSNEAMAMEIHEGSLRLKPGVEVSPCSVGKSQEKQCSKEPMGMGLKPGGG